MKIQPTLEEVKEIAASGHYNVLPVSLELLSDFTTPIARSFEDAPKLRPLRDTTPLRRMPPPSRKN